MKAVAFDEKDALKHRPNPAEVGWVFYTQLFVKENFYE